MGGGRRGWFREDCAKEVEVIRSVGIVDARGPCCIQHVDENEIPKRSQIHRGKGADRVG